MQDVLYAAFPNVNPSIDHHLVSTLEQQRRTSMAITTAVIVRLDVAGQKAQVSLRDVNAIMYGDEAFKLAIPEGGFSLKLEDLMKFLKEQLKFDTDGLPQQIRNLAANTSFTLHKLMYKQYKYDTAQDGKRTPHMLTAQTPAPADFGISMTLDFASGSPHAGLLTDLTGVDLTSILDIEACTFSLYTDYFKSDFKELSQEESQLPGSDGKTPAIPAAIPTGPKEAPSIAQP